MATTLSVKQAAELAGVSERTIRNRINAGDIRALKKDGKYGPTYFIPSSEVVRSAAHDSELQPSAVATGADPSQTPAFAGVETDFTSVLLELTNQVRDQAEQIGRFKALTERSESLETEAATIRRERDDHEVARRDLETKVAQLVTERDELLARSLERKRWFGTRRKPAARAQA